jgi:hypothetical protein
MVGGNDPKLIYVCDGEGSGSWLISPDKNNIIFSIVREASAMALNRVQEMV